MGIFLTIALWAITGAASFMLVRRLLNIHDYKEEKMYDTQQAEQLDIKEKKTT